ncbi:single-stranded DNA-binding protein [Microbacterium testaceum]|uniref:single-stranded DNA-binding protein n=1 Tax=Microbacterium testaceum TaxID=2033 RepID=UPI001248ECAC|nr:single-stranded DNA-binding protein [Microbacterium testaceum]
MSDHITLVGNIVGELEQRSTRNGGPIAAFRLAVGERRLDRERGEWVDGHTNYYNASVFGDLGAHALTSLRKGQRVVLTGRLRLREWENESKRGVSADVTVDAIGHDLRWGTSTFERAGKPSADALAGGAEAVAAAAEEAWAAPGVDESTNGLDVIGVGAGVEGAPSAGAREDGPF